MAQRTPLAPLDLNRIKNKELSPYLQGSIQTWATINLGTAEITRKTFLMPEIIKLIFLYNLQYYEGIILSFSGYL